MGLVKKESIPEEPSAQDPAMPKVEEEEVKQNPVQAYVQDIPEMDEGDQLWSCEFCNHYNVINLEDEEIPKKDTVNYILENENAEENKQSK